MKRNIESEDRGSLPHEITNLDKKSTLIVLTGILGVGSVIAGINFVLDGMFAVSPGPAVQADYEKGVVGIVGGFIVTAAATKFLERRERLNKPQ